MRDNFNKKDSLTAFERKVYKIIWSVLFFGSLASFFFALKITNHVVQNYIILFSIVLLSMSAIFGYGLKNDIRVLDLRKFGNK